jgi:hypothetical protein
MCEESEARDALGDALDRIEASFDRFREAHYWIHGLETHYHEAEHFRWHLGAFLKALKEVPQPLHMELQRAPKFSNWFRDRRDQLNRDRLILYLSKQRDIIVHQRMLLPNSECVVGLTELRGIKLGASFSANPRCDSAWGFGAVRHVNFLDRLTIEWAYFGAN